MTALPQPPAAPPAPSGASRPARSRIQGVDAARALAILGMVMVHFGPFEPATSDLLGTAYRSTHGRASVLFVLLAGVGISLLFAARPPAEAWTRIGWRVVVFFPLGVWLQALPTPVAVILQFYACYYLLGGLAALLPTRWLVALTATWTAVGPLLYTLLQDPTLSGRGSASTVSDPAAVVADLLVTGYYPLITWAPPLLVGLLVGRTDLRDRTTQAVLALGGALTAAAAYGGSEVARTVTGSDAHVLLAEGHTGAPLNVVGATAVALAVLAVCLLVVDAVPRLTWPLVAMGQMALTVYVGHLLVLAVAPEWLEGRDAVEDAIRKVGRFTLVVLVTCSLWRLRFARGPLEALLALPFRTGRRGAGGGGWQQERSTPDRGSPSWPSTSAPSPSSPSTPTSGSSGGTRPPTG